MKRIIIISKTAQKCLSALVIAILLMTFATSCQIKSKIDEPAESENPNKEVNDWILENMEIYYLWNTQIPSKTNQTLSPVEYFETLLYKTEDRFSWIQKDYLELLNSLSGVNTEAGYDFTLVGIPGTHPNTHDVVGYITYIKSGTPAEAAGLKRGDFFQKINGTKMTLDNYSSLLGQMSKPHTLEISVLSEDYKLTGNTNVSLQVIENYAENPVLLDTIYDISGKNIGYLVYNFFARDKGDGSVTYEKELNAIFGKFKSAQIDELIVDLRYNGGGAVSTAQTLASMISQRKTSDVFCIYQYNSLLNEYFSNREGPDYNILYFVNTIDRYNSSGKVAERVPINSLSGLSTVHFIVTGSSASASELLINGLTPYMKVVLVGKKTYGKNMASITIYEEDVEKQKTNKWGMQPIISKMANSKWFSDYGNGFLPNADVHELNGGFAIKQLGDTAEIMLKTTLNLISGINTKSVVTKRFDNQTVFVGSAMDRTPARRNQYISLKDLPMRKDR
jgi:C-terminal processing protease CtpA/Prc